MRLRTINLTSPGIFSRPHIVMRWLIAFATFSERMSSRVILNDHLFAVDVISQLSRHNWFFVIPQNSVAVAIGQWNHFLSNWLLTIWNA